MLSVPACWALTVLLELPWYLWGFARQKNEGRRPLAQRCVLCLGANLVSYPWVSVVFPACYSSTDYDRYLAVAETFAPVSELLWTGWALRRILTVREAFGVVAANLTSWLFGVWLVEHLLP